MFLIFYWLLGETEQEEEEMRALCSRDPQHQAFLIRVAALRRAKGPHDPARMGTRGDRSRGRGSA